MSVSYKKLWKLLIDKEMTKSELGKLAGISGPTIAKMGKNEYVALEVIERICHALNCQPSDIVEIESKENKK